jgi:hypothetical protein
MDQLGRLFECEILFLATSKGTMETPAINDLIGKEMLFKNLIANSQNPCQMLRNLLVATVMLLCLPSYSLGDLTWEFNTSDSPINGKSRNQGFYTNRGFNNPSNVNYLTGQLFSAPATTTELRSFFTFDLSSLDLSGRVITSAALQLTQFSGSSTRSLLLYDVSTPAIQLNLGSAFDSPTGIAIFNDLGSGNLYGSAVIGPGSVSQVVSIPINATALDHIANAAGGFFSIGGRLDLTGAPVNQSFSLFGGSGPSGVQRLSITTAAVPEPGTTALLATGLLGLIGGYCFRKKRTLLILTNVSVP